MGTGPAAAGVGSVAEQAVIAGSAVVDLPAGSVIFAPVIGTPIVIIALGIYKADAPVDLFRAVQTGCRAGIADMLAKPEEVCWKLREQLY